MSAGDKVVTCDRFTGDSLGLLRVLVGHDPRLNLEALLESRDQKVLKSKANSMSSGLVSRVDFGWTMH